ncbi:MAG: glycosyltransferase family 4 protein [Anaerolineae bacterium]|nr:glycosyltransferase family 4 protein [Anaerolineae bacterium]NUQ04698.1 glycosyltransferase family 4 protein [Anaerolineae bacterium]
MTHLLVFNLAVDVDDPILGFATDWLNRLAERFSTVDVITMRAGRVDVAANVRVWSVGKEKGYGETRRALIFYAMLLRLLLTRRYAACFAHMMPLFALMAAPLLAIFRVPQTLWYTHRQVHPILRWATRVVRRVVTAAPDSFPIPTGKLRVVGHGIDTAAFAPASPAEGESPVIVQVARLMPIKRQSSLIQAVARMTQVRAHIIFVGGVPPEQPIDYQRDLERLAADLGLSAQVRFAGDQDREGVIANLRSATVAVNLSPPGLFDKAALESMACAVPTLVSSPAFRPLLGEWDPLLRVESPEDDAALAARLDVLLSLPDAERHRIGEELRAHVQAAHGLEGLIDRLVSVLLTGEIRA